jgi:NADPH:quinone reductase-like Zn-dependent oxidoreductase
MKAVVLHDFEHGPSLTELPTTQPGESELLVRVLASSVNPADAAIAAGMLKGMAEYAQRRSSIVVVRRKRLRRGS